METAGHKVERGNSQLKKVRTNMAAQVMLTFIVGCGACQVQQKTKILSIRLLYSSRGCYNIGSGDSCSCNSIRLNMFPLYLIF